MGWDKMTGVEGGRYCQACDKVVVDFTHMSDEQLIDFFTKKAAGAHPCGHFRTDQLDRVLAAPQPHKASGFLKLAASFLMAQALFYQEKAFGRTKPQIEITNPAEVTNQRQIALTGVVMDYHSGQPISGLKVYIDSTELFAITDKHGRFSIQVPKSVKGEITILTEYVNNKNYVAGSMILEKKGDVIDLSANEIILYRYPEEELDKAVIVDYVLPEIDPGRTTGGAPVVIRTVKKETFWHKMTRVFRKK